MKALAGEAHPDVVTDTAGEARWSDRTQPPFADPDLDDLLPAHRLDDGFNAAAFLHDTGVLVDVWTIDATTRGWRERVARAVAAGVDIVTTNTPRELAAAFP